MSDPIFNADDLIQKLSTEADEAGVSERSLDDLVQDTYAKMASDTNNAGLEGQITFLVTQYGPDAEKMILDAFNEED